MNIKTAGLYIAISAVAGISFVIMHHLTGLLEDAA